MLASGARRSSWTASVPWRLLVSALGHGRPAIVATAPVVWLAVTFLPDIHPALRLSSWLATAAVIGLGAELAAHAASILLRDARAGRAAGLGLVGVTAVVVGELALVLSSTAAAPWVCGALLVLALYAASGVCHAVLDGAPRHVYLELALVTGAG